VTKRATVMLGSNQLRRVMVQALAVAGAGLLTALLWLAAVREPLALADSKKQLAQVAVNTRAHSIALYISDLERRIEHLAGSLAPYSVATSLAPETIGFTDAASVSYIPLGDLGTVRITPGDYGLKSHIDIDIVRRAFAGEQPVPESISGENGAYTLFARGSGDPIHGVVLMEVTHSRLAKLASASDEGRYRLVQKQQNGAVFSVVGELAGEVAASATIPGSLWSLEFQPEDDWLAMIQPSWWSLAGAFVIAAATLLVAAYWLLKQTPLILSKEVSRLLAKMDTEDSIIVNTPALAPFVSALIQATGRAKPRPSMPQKVTAGTDSPKASREPLAEQESAQGSLAEALTASNAGTPATTQAVTAAEDGIPEILFEESRIRGAVDTELTPEMVEQIGQAIAVQCRDKSLSSLVVASDGKAVSEQIRGPLTRSLVASGIDILDIGSASMPLLRFATHSTDSTSGIMVTSDPHDERAATLEILFDRRPVSGEGIDQILKTLKAGSRVSGAGRAAKQAISTRYIDKVLCDVNLALPLKVVIDVAHGAAGDVAISLIESLGCEVVGVNADPPGTGQESHNLEQALSQLGRIVGETGADLGVLIDQAGEKLHTVTNEGVPVATDQLMMMLAQDVLERNPGADVIYDVNYSRHFAPFITSCGGRAQMARSGPAFVAEKSLQTHALVAATFSGHIFYTERWYGFEDALYATARLLEVLSSQSESFQDRLSHLPSGVSTPEIFLPLDTTVRKRVMRSLQGHPDFPGARITTLDGLRIDYADGWGVIRNSIPDGALVIRLEGNDSTSLSRIKNVLQQALSEAAPDLTISL
jgi:phosphomannomutase/phosphoglucomutase